MILNKGAKNNILKIKIYSRRPSRIQGKLGNIANPKKPFL